jgi:hypothetical protein
VETVIGSIAVAALTGLTFVAYKHPDAYRKLCVALTITTMIVNIVFLSWNMSNKAAFNAFFAQNKLDQEHAFIAREIVLSAVAPDWIVLLTIAATFYLAFLYSFRYWLLSDVRKNEGEGG